jgi:YwiC-like protein
MVQCEVRTMTKPATNIRAVALPAEHGGWALILEPVALGLLVAPSVDGLLIAAGSLAAFLARHPLKLAIGDRRKSRILKRTPLADRFALLYVTLAAVFFTIAITSLPRDFLLPFIIAGPLLFVQFLYDARGHSRKMTAEVAGALAVGSISTAIALAGGWPWSKAFALWVIVACRHVPTILYLRVLLSRRRQEQRPGVNAAVVVVQLLPLIAIFVLLYFKITPVVAIVVFAILFGRAVIGLFKQAEPIPKKLGISEIAFGTLTVLLVAAGYRFGL